MLKNHNVSGNVIFPLVFPTKSDSYESAVGYANSIFNSSTVLKVEMDVYTADGRKHLIICDEFNFQWNDSK
jgi:hypothetical protein